MINLSAFIAFHARRNPEKTAFTYQGVPVSYRSFTERIERTAGWLKAQGVGEDTVVALLMKNSAAFLELVFATSHLGAVFLPINYRLSADEVDYIVADSNAHMLFVDSEFAHNAGSRCKVVELDERAQLDPAVFSGSATPSPAAHRSTSDLIRLMYTSGTTDRPKGVMHTYDNFYWKTLAHVAELELTSDTRLLVALPLYHVGAFDLPGISVLWSGGTLVVHRDFDAERVLATIESEAITGAAMVPVMTGMLLGCTNRERYDMSSLQWIVGGGEKTPESRIRAFNEYFSNARYIDAYGLTETCSGDTFMEAGRELEKIGSAGKPTLHVEVEIRDDAGNTLPAGEIGEICLRGPKVFKGYWNDPVRTEAAFHEGWFRSGDIGLLDEEGFIYLTDRKKDMIISGGENIASSEVERVIYELPQVRETAVVGKPHPHWGEEPVAFVVLEEGAELTLEALDRHCRSRLAGFKSPKTLMVVDSLPRTATGKVLKRNLRTLFSDEPNTAGEKNGH